MDNIKTRIFISNVDCLENGALFDALYNSVSKKRREKIDRFRFESDKRLSLGVELLFKKALEDCGIKYDSVEIVYGKNEKPYIRGNKVYFNLSHSENMACCAISQSEIGVDTEKISKADFRLSERIYTDKENEFVCGSKERFIRLWALKESYMKYCGSGLSIAPRDIEFEFIDDIPHYKDLSFFEYETEGYRFALCGAENAEIIKVNLGE